MLPRRGRGPRRKCKRLQAAGWKRFQLDKNFFDEYLVFKNCFDQFETFLFGALQSEKIRVNHELNDDEIINTLKKFVKQKKDNIEEYTNYGKDDVVADLKREVELVSKYLPEELSEDEINKGLDEIFAKVQPTSIKDMGKLMAEANTLFGVKADKSLVSKLIKDRLI